MAKGRCGHRGKQAAIWIQGYSSPPTAVAARGLIVARLEGTQRVRFYPCGAAITQTENKASFFMQRCTMVNRRKACLGGTQVSNQFQNGSAITTDVYLIYFFFFFLALPDVYTLRVKFSPAPLDRFKKVQKSPAAERHVSLELLCSSFYASNCTGTSCTPRGAREPSCCGDQNWALPTPAAEPAVGKAPFSCRRKKQPRVSGAGAAAPAGC